MLVGANAGVVRADDISHFLNALHVALDAREEVPQADYATGICDLAFGTLMLMLAVLYTFMAKGWIR